MKQELFFVIHEDDDGYADVMLGEREKPDEAKKLLEIDLWKVWGEIEAMRAQTNANPDASLLASTVEYLANQGVQASHKRANAFLKEHTRAVDEEGKAGPGGSTPDSPGSTESPSSTAAPESSSASPPT